MARGVEEGPSVEVAGQKPRVTFAPVTASGMT